MPPSKPQPALHRQPGRPGRPPRRSGLRARPRLESLESRTVLYSASGNLWPSPALITISIMPDGTNLGGPTSNLNSVFNSKPGLNQAGNDWKTIIERAAQTWAAETNINFAMVTDNGAPEGSGANQQGDPGFGDIRIGGYNFGTTSLARAYMPPPVNNYSIAGDIQFNTGQSFNVNSTYDLYSVAVHEIGHALGLYHSGIASAELYSSYNGVKNALTSDDIAGIESIYSGGSARNMSNVAFGAGHNNSLATAADISSQVKSAKGVVNGLSLNRVGEADYFFVSGAALGNNSPLTLLVQSRGLSLLSPTVTVYAADKTTVLGSASGAGQYGTTVTVGNLNVTGAGGVYIKVAGADGSVFSTGSFAMALSGGGNAPPSVPLPNTTLANGSPLSSGGGQAVKVNQETLVNTYTAGKQGNWQYASHFTAMDASGNYVITWQSAGQDGDGQGIYAQRFDVNGNAVGGEFRVNTTTRSDQTTPSVAMDANGDFVIIWTSLGQDAASSLGVYGQRYNNQGVAQGGEFRVNTTTAGDQQFPEVAMDQSGNFTVTWSSGSQDGSGKGVYAQRYTALGVPLGLETRVNTTTAGGQFHSRVGMDYLGDAVITWTSNGQDGSGLGVYAQRFSPAGVALGGEFRVNTTTAGDQSYSSVGLDALGNFTIVWQSFAQDGSGWGIYAQRFNNLGLAQGDEVHVSTTTTGDQAFPSISMDDGGDFLISWSSNPTPSTSSTSFPIVTTYWNTFGMQYTANGQPLGNEVQLNTSAGSDQKYSSLAMDSQGHVVVSWSGGNAKDPNGVLAQQFNISFSGESADGFFAQGDPNDPDQGAPAAPPEPVQVTTPSDTSGGDRRDQGPPALSPGRVDLILNGPEDLFSHAVSLRARHASGTSSVAIRTSHRAMHSHKAGGTPKSGLTGLDAHSVPLHTLDHHNRHDKHHHA